MNREHPDESRTRRAGNKQTALPITEPNKTKHLRRTRSNCGRASDLAGDGETHAAPRKLHDETCHQTLGAGCVGYARILDGKAHLD
jgi:hypothetical protein